MEMPELNEVFAQRYRIESILGEGGFSTVYLAIDEQASRPVALKVLRPEKNGSYLAEIESRFEREVKVVAQLTNVHTVTLFDFGRHQGLLYMVCERVPGRDLAEVLAETPVLPPDVVMHILQQVLESLAEAHRHGLLHRDIKPENIRIYEYNGDPYCAKVLDFGIARPADQAREAALTADGELLGTPRYMAPEQLMEEELSPASDIYSLGLVALEMLVGPSALLGNRWSDQFDRLMTGHMFAIGEFEKIGPSLRAFVAKMTAREAHERFQSADAALRALAMVTKHDQDSEPSEDRLRPILGAAPTIDEPRYVAPRPADAPPPGLSRGWIIAAVGLSCAVVLLGVFTKGLLDEAEEGDLPPPVPREIALLKTDTGSEPAPVVVEHADVGSSTDMQLVDVGPLSAGCGKRPSFEGIGDLVHMAGPLTQRDWPVYIPSGYDPRKPHPLVILLHRDAQTGPEIIELSRFGELADEKGFVIVAPTDRGHMNSWRDESKVEFVKDAVTDMFEELCIDHARVFAVSHGSGGHTVERISCGGWVTAVATNGFRTEEQEFLCQTPVPSLHIAPMKSKRMLIEGGKDCLVMAEPLPLDFHNRKWIERNQCNKGRDLMSSDPNGDCYRYRGCEKPYVTCQLPAGYGWPGAKTRPPDPAGCNDIVPKFDATKAIWDFFESVSG